MLLLMMLMMMILVSTFPFFICIVMNQIMILINRIGETFGVIRDKVKYIIDKLECQRCLQTTLSSRHLQDTCCFLAQCGGTSGLKVHSSNSRDVLRESLASDLEGLWFLQTVPANRRHQCNSQEACLFRDTVWRNQQPTGEGTVSP